MSWLKPKNVENYTGMESEQAFGDEMPNFDICGTVDVLDVDAKTETAASSENSGRKSTENEQLEVLYKHTICTGVSQWCKSLMMTVKVKFLINTVELEVKYLYNDLNAAAICLRTSATQFSATTSISTLEPITSCKRVTSIPRNIDGSRLGKTLRKSRYFYKFIYEVSFS